VVKQNLIWYILNYNKKKHQLSLQKVTHQYNKNLVHKEAKQHTTNWFLCVLSAWPERVGEHVMGHEGEQVMG
jgi:hypothetical protein